MNAKKIINFLFSKVCIVSILICIQLAFLVWVVMSLSENFVPMYFIFILLSFCMSIYTINRNDNPSYKIAWIILIMSLPILGGLVYVLFGGQKVPKELRIRDRASKQLNQEIIWQNYELMERLEKIDPSAFKQANYLWKQADFPMYQNTTAKFFPLGEDKFEEMLIQLKQAKKFIFLEYFIIEEGFMWNSILDVLKQKVQEQVEVRILYDDAGCIGKLSDKYYLKLRKLGIKCKVFNPIRPRLAMQMNNRDHRKILVIDGRIAMTGGINLADEYINKTERFGHWKDCAVMLNGEAVWSFTLMFLQFWNYDEKEKDDPFQYKYDFTTTQLKSDGFVQPFSDSPTDCENVGENTHLNMIHGANRYVYATTPYLVIDHEMRQALMLAAKNGVDVRILVPHIPDKWYVFQVTQANYYDLIESGVKIYEYTPGFVHAKTFISDDRMAIVGTVNMDFRSYYLHYECGVCFYQGKIIEDIKSDYLNSLANSHLVTLEECNQVSWFTRVIRSLLNLFAPMM